MIHNHKTLPLLLLLSACGARQEEGDLPATDRVEAAAPEKTHFTPRNVIQGLGVSGVRDAGSWTPDRFDDTEPEVQEETPSEAPFVLGAAVGGLYSYAWDSDGRVWSMGLAGSADDLAAAGLGACDGVSHLTPGLIPDLSGVVEVDAGWSFAVALDEEGRVFAWGTNERGQLALADVPYHCSPAQVLGLPPIVDIAVGDNFAVALDDDGVLWTWGAGDLGQLGDGGHGDSSQPYRIESPMEFVGVSAGFDFVLAVDVDGTLSTWGSNRLGQLGYHTMGMGSTPAVLELPARFTAVWTGNFAGFALDSDSQMWSWGQYQGDGVVDDGRPDIDLPATNSALNAMRSIEGGKEHTIAMDQWSRLVVWGVNSMGQLGMDNEDTYSTMSPLPLDLQVVQVAAGYYSSAAVDSEGQLYTWGDNGQGQLGLGDRDLRAEPTRVVFPGEAVE